MGAIRKDDEPVRARVLSIGKSHAENMQYGISYCTRCGKQVDLRKGAAYVSGETGPLCSYCMCAAKGGVPKIKDVREYRP